MFYPRCLIQVWLGVGQDVLVFGDDRQPVLAVRCQCRGMKGHDAVYYQMHMNQSQKQQSTSYTTKKKP